MKQHLIKINLIENIQRTGTLSRSFGVHDDKNRLLGSRVSIYEGDRVVVEKSVYIGTQQGELKPAGRVYGFCPQAMRDDKPFGASQAGRHFDSVKERADAIETYFDQALKRAHKTAA